MPAIPAIAFLIAFLVCSLIGRILLVKAAFKVSPPWGLTVLLVPFGPFIFRMKHRDLAFPTRNWRRGATVLLVLFFINGGNADSLHALTDFGKTGPVIASAGDTQFHFSTPAPVATPTPAPIAAAAGQPVPAAGAAAKPAAGTPAATPSKAVVAAGSTMAPAPQLLSPAERIEANRKEFERLAEWYDNLKHERGYLRKGDSEAVEAYNAQAAKYQTALQLAKTEQAELAKLMAKK